MKIFIMILGFCLEVGCFTTLLSMYDTKAWLLAVGAALVQQLLMVCK